MTFEENEYIKYLDDIQGDGYGLLLYKGDPIAFEVGMNEWQRENNLFGVDEDDDSICKEIKSIDIDWEAHGNENLTVTFLRQKFENMNEAITAKREAFSDLAEMVEYIVDFDGTEFEQNRFQYDGIMARSSDYLSSPKEWDDHIEHIHHMFSKEAGHDEPSNELCVFVEKVKNAYEDAVLLIEKEYGIDFDQIKFDDSLESFLDEYKPKMNEFWVLQNCPTQSEIEDLIENAPNISIVEVEEEMYISMNAGGMDMTNEIAYAYLMIDGIIPDEVGSLKFNDAIKGSEKLYSTLMAYAGKTKLYADTSKNIPTALKI